jgi:hypothetical protein
LILINLFGQAVRTAATECDGDVAWLDLLVAVALVGLIVTIGLALRAANRRRARTDPEPGPPWLSPMYDPWLDG